MDRRAFIGRLALGLLAALPTGRAQSQVPPRRIAFLSSEAPLSPTCNPPNVAIRAFLEGLHSLGYRDGQNVAIECRSPEGKYERLGLVLNAGLRTSR